VLILQSLGVKTVSALLGGYNGWLSSGHSVVAGDKVK
jgi:3-mercaptopyruvate sulfurtransferase SseA